MSTLAPTGHDGHDGEPISAGAWSGPIGGFRGLGALIVVVGHTFFATRTYPWRGVIHFLSIIVPVFFVISGYALYRPFMAAQVAGAEAPSATGFWWKRFLRIYPLYGFALTLYLLLLPGVRPESGRVIDYVKLYGFAQIYDPDLVRFSGIPAAWFLCDEVVFYLMVPFLAALALWVARRVPGRRGGPRRSRTASILRGHVIVAAVMIVIGQVARTWLLRAGNPAATSLPVSNLDYYGFGILLGVASLREHAGLPLPRPVDWLRRRAWVSVGVLIAGILAMNAIAARPGATAGATEDIQRYAIYSLITIPFMTVLCLGYQRRGFNQGLSSPRWNHLAAISLHTYLWHQLVLGGFDRFVTPAADVRWGGRFVTGLAMVTMAVVVTVLWASLWRPLLDWPYRKLSKAFPRPAAAGPYPVWVRPAAIGTAVVLLSGGAWVSIRYGGSPVQARGGVQLVTVTDARPGDEIEVLQAGRRRGHGNADGSGSLVIRGLRPGRYDVVQIRDGRRIIERTATVLAVDDHPAPSFYDSQTLRPGRNEIVTRDGTRLSAWVELPGPADHGPYPTVVEYSGYQVADGDVTQPASAVARALGYATVGVNVRGSGCSAGAFEMLSDTQAADGYDVVETVAAQGWVKGGTVGLVGFSYGGLGALEAASTRPPSLNSVTALSVYGEAWQAFHPGGLANSGFPVGWMQDLARDAQPYGTDWVRARIAKGDRACARNQTLHGQQVDLTARYLGNGVPHDRRFAPMSPATWAPKIDVPVFLTAQLQDATIGTDLPAYYGAFDRSPYVKLVMTNGTHGDAVSPQLLDRLHQFLGIYVAGQVPQRFDAAAVLNEAQPTASADKIPASPPSPVVFPTGIDPARAKEIYQGAPHIELLLDSGGGAQPGAAAAVGSVGFPSWPPLQAKPTSLRLAADGTLAPADPATAPDDDDDPTARFTTDPDVAGDAYNVEGSNLLANAISRWRQPAAGTAASWLSAPQLDDVIVAGTTTLDLWVRADVSDADLQATLSEVDPDGNETFIQAGWRRISDTTGADHAPLPGAWTKVPVRLGAAGHVLRAGSRLRLVVGTPGDGQVQWSFYPPPDGAAVVDVGQGGRRASTLTVPIVSAVPDLGRRPACGALRGQPCRPFRAFPNEAGTR